MSPDELKRLRELVAILRGLPIVAQMCPSESHEMHSCNSIPCLDQAAVLLVAGELEAVLVRASAPSVVEPATCQWEFDHEDDDLGNFITTCGETFCPLDSDPNGSERWLKFCCYCGKPVEFVAPSAVEAKEPQ